MIIAALPAYNEEVAIGSIVLRARKHVDKVIVVDDGSTDATAEVAKLAGAEVIRHERNEGYGSAIYSCICAARKRGADALVILDADGQHNPEEIPSLLEPVLKGEADLVIGSRFLNGWKNNDVPTYRRIGIGIINFFTNLGSKQKISDSQSGFRAYSKRAIDEIRFGGEGMGMSANILLQAQKLGLKIAEKPASCRYDLEDVSTHRPFGHGLKVLVSIVRYIGREHPLTFFGIPGLILLLIGTALGLWVVDVYQTKHAFAIGSALITVLLILIGIFSMFIGLVLYSVSSLIRERSNMRNSQ
jgi:glycosyltransferase involved in cell wall biosynthesis